MKPLEPNAGESPAAPRLEPFEHYLLSDERSGYPMVFPFVLRFRGTVDRAALDRAFAETLSTEPLLMSRVVPGRGGLAWRPVDNAPRLAWSDDPRSLDETRESPIPIEPIDLRAGPGIAARAVVHPDGVVFTCWFHHAGTDGLGAKRFVADVIARYGQAVDDEQGLAIKPPDVTHTDRRGRLDIQLPGPISAWEMTRGIAGEIYKWLARRPRPLAGEGGDPTAVGPVVLWRRLDAATVSGLRRCGKRVGAGLNDLLIRDLLVTCDGWNERRGARRERDHLRVLIPTNLRKAIHRRTPAANVLGYAFLTRRAGDCRDPSALLDGVRDEMKFIVAWSLGSMFLDGLKLFRRVPGAVRLLTRGPFCHATCVLSNLGPLHAGLSASRFRRERTLRAGDLTLDDMIAAPPVRPRTWASFCVIGHGETLTLGMNTDLRQVDEATAREFLDAYCRQLAATAATG